MYYINTLKQDLRTAKTYEHNRRDETSVVDKHRCHMVVKFGAFVDEDRSKLPSLYCYLNFKNDPISRVLLLILVHVVHTFDVMPHCD